MDCDYDDNYATCSETYATLRIYSDHLSPDEISGILGQTPTKYFVKGDVRSKNAPEKHRTHKANGWFYCTKILSNSKDCRRHLDLLVSNVLKEHSALAQLRESRCKMDISIFYCYTQGGPTISQKQMKSLSMAGLDVWWDLYRDDREDESPIA